jgi:hypothetical protein
MHRRFGTDDVAQNALRVIEEAIVAGLVALKVHRPE